MKIFTSVLFGVLFLGNANASVITNYCQDTRSVQFLLTEIDGVFKHAKTPPEKDYSGDYVFSNFLKITDLPVIKNTREFVLRVHESYSYFGRPIETDIYAICTVGTEEK